MEEIQQQNSNPQETIKLPNLDESMKKALEDNLFSKEELLDLIDKFSSERTDLYTKYLDYNKIILEQSSELLDDILSQFMIGEDFTPQSVKDMFLYVENKPNIKKKFIYRLKERSNSLALSYISKFINEDYSKDLLLDIVSSGFGPEIFTHIETFKTKPYAKELLLKAIEDNQDSAFAFFDTYKDMPYAKEILLKTVKINPFSAFEHDNMYDDMPYEKEIKDSIKNKEDILRGMKDNKTLFFDYFKFYKNEKFTKKILEILAKEESFLVLKYSDKFKKEEYSSDILNEAKIKENILKETQKSPEQTFEIFASYENLPYAKEVLLLAAKLSPIKAFSEINKYKKKPYFREILELATDSIQDINLQEKDYLFIGQLINSFHNEKDDFRFMIIANLDENKLYNLIHIGRAEIFTSTYNGIINRLLEKLKIQNRDIYDLALVNNFDGINTFIEASVSYNRSDELISTIKDENKKKELIDKLFDENRIQGDLKNYVSIIEIIGKIDNPELIDYMGVKIEENYESGKNKEAWGIIAKSFAYKLKGDFFKSLDDSYKLSDIQSLKNKELFDEKGINIQQYYFYNDEDGKASFNSFISNYKQESWKITDKGTYLIINSISKNGKKIIIYANKPENDGYDDSKKDGISDIKNSLDKNNITPTIIVHRGHSYHAEKTVSNIESSAKMVFLGSCGGFQEIARVLDKSANAQIISTKGIGTMSVNDPLFKAINESILNGQDINWEKIWIEISPKLKNNPYFKDYIRPDQNLPALFFKKYNDLKKLNKEETSFTNYD